MKKLLGLLFAIAIIFSLATPVLAQSDGPPKAQGTGKQAKEVHAKKKKHHKKKHRHVVEVQGQGAVEGVLS